MATLPAAATECLAQIGSILECLPVDDSPATVAENLALVRRIAERDYIVPLLERVINDSHMLAEVASRSYRHVNYFDKIVLVGSDKLHGYRLTLHLWCPPYSDNELKKESLHDHRFNFWSVVLAGTVTSENFVESEEGTVMQHYRYIPEKRTAEVRNFYEFVGDAKLVNSQTLQRCAGESYYQPAVGIHRVLLPQKISCTLVLRGPRKKAFTNTYRTDLPKVNRQVENQMFTEETVAEKIKALLSAIRVE